MGQHACNSICNSPGIPQQSIIATNHCVFSTSILCNLPKNKVVFHFRRKACSGNRRLQWHRLCHSRACSQGRCVCDPHSSKPGQATTSQGFSDSRTQLLARRCSHQSKHTPSKTMSVKRPICSPFYSHFPSKLSSLL
jgi:hypothetical protein